MGLTGAFLYMVLLGFGATITPGVGTTGALLALVPQPLTEYSHVPAYGLLTWLLTSCLQGRSWPKGTALWVSALAAMVFGLWMEILQGFVPGRFVDIGDVALNAVGVGLATLFITWAPGRRTCALANRFLHLRMMK